MDYLNQIITGDARELSKEITDKSIDLIFTDPPYIKKFMYLYDWLSDEGTRVLKDDGFLMCYAGIYWKSQIFRTMERNLEYFWDFVLLDSGNSAIMWQRKIISRYKSLLCFRKPGFNALPHTNVLSSWVGGGEDKRFHTWGQDESSARYYIDCFSKPGNVVFDPFCGGGTTPVVCKMLNRNFISFEIDEESAER
jgi:DNA modification methylase